MDDIVKQAIARWPNVPHCYGWLALDGRGAWWLRDMAAQAAGDFPQSRGSRLEHAALKGFIARNYAADEAGQWFFQNGPQRVYVELEHAPIIWRLHEAPDDNNGAAGPPRIQPHAGPLLGRCLDDPQAVLVDEYGHLYLHCATLLGLVHSQDMLLAAQAIEHGHWRKPVQMPWADIARHYHFVRSPARQQ